MIPVKSILRDFVSVDEDDDQAEDTTEDTSTATTTTTTATAATHSPSTQDLSANEVIAPTVPTAPIVPDVLEPIVTPEPIPTGTASQEASDGSAQQLIVIDTDRKPSVNFAQYNSVFDSDYPEGSDMVEESEEPGLEIMEDSGVPLDMGDVEELDKPAAKPVIQESSENLGSDDFDVLV
jgi:hypothetical protein